MLHQKSEPGKVHAMDKGDGMGHWLTNGEIGAHAILSKPPTFIVVGYGSVMAPNLYGPSSSQNAKQKSFICDPSDRAATLYKGLT